MKETWRPIVVLDKTAIFFLSLPPLHRPSLFYQPDFLRDAKRSCDLKVSKYARHKLRSEIERFSGFIEEARADLRNTSSKPTFRNLRDALAKVCMRSKMSVPEISKLLKLFDFLKTFVAETVRQSGKYEAEGGPTPSQFYTEYRNVLAVIKMRLSFLDYMGYGVLNSPEPRGHNKKEPCPAKKLLEKIRNLDFIKTFIQTKDLEKWTCDQVMQFVRNLYNGYRNRLGHSEDFNKAFSRIQEDQNGDKFAISFKMIIELRQYLEDAEEDIDSNRNLIKYLFVLLRRIKESLEWWHKALDESEPLPKCICDWDFAVVYAQALHDQVSAAVEKNFAKADYLYTFDKRYAPLSKHRFTTPRAQSRSGSIKLIPPPKKVILNPRFEARRSVPDAKIEVDVDTGHRTFRATIFDYGFPFVQGISLKKTEDLRRLKPWTNIVGFEITPKLRVALAGKASIPEIVDLPLRRGMNKALFLNFSRQRQGGHPFPTARFVFYPFLKSLDIDCICSLPPGTT